MVKLGQELMLCGLGDQELLKVRGSSLSAQAGGLGEAALGVGGVLRSGICSSGLGASIPSHTAPKPPGAGIYRMPLCRLQPSLGPRWGTQLRRLEAELWLW